MSKTMSPEEREEFNELRTVVVSLTNHVGRMTQLNSSIGRLVFSSADIPEGKKEELLENLAQIGASGETLRQIAELLSTRSASSTDSDIDVRVGTNAQLSKMLSILYGEMALGLQAQGFLAEIIISLATHMSEQQLSTLSSVAQRAYASADNLMESIKVFELPPSGLADV